MLRLTLMLSAAIYAGMIIYSDDYSGGAPPPSGPAAVDVARAAVPKLDLTNARSITTPDGRTLTFAFVIDPADIPANLDVVAAISTATPDIAVPVAGTGAGTVAAAGAGTVAVAGTGPVLPIVEVTGDQVNLRAGPSTDDAVLGSVIRGQRAELIAPAADGWARIRVVATGVEGFMADRFLAVVN